MDLAEALYQHLLDRFPADRDYPRGAFYVEGMPPLVASLLGRTLDRWLEHELDALESRWFDFEDPAVRAARAELIVALARTARVPRGAWAETLRYAVELVVRHLVTPARALTDATFEGQPDPLPVGTVRSRLHTFEAYPYLAEIADAYLAQKLPATVDPDTLYGLLLRIERRVTEDYGAEDWLRLLGPLFRLARALPEMKGVPAPLLEVFFEAKGQKALAGAVAERALRVFDEPALHKTLASVLGERAEAGAPAAQPAPEHAAPATAATGHVGVEPAALEDALEDQQPDTPEMPPAPAHTDRVAAGADAADVRGGSTTPFSDAPAVMPAPPDDEEEPLWKQFAREPIGPTLDTALPTPEAPRQTPHGPADGPLWQRFLAGIRGAASGTEPETPGHTPPSTTPSLDELEERVLGKVSPRQRARFVRDLFEGDDAAYAATLQQIDRCETWSEASQVIAREVFRRYRIDIYSDAAVAFTDGVNAVFEG